MSSANYRPEIDGLRAFAVVPVLIFHLSPTSLPGGYLGVDVFFVISGFLITSILLNQLQGKTFSFRQFWLRRVKRLFPAVAVVLCTTLFVGYFTQFGDEWRSVSRQSVSALTGWANIFMWRHANDYWGESAETMPLLHTWSLSVEEQFYLIFPLALYGLFRLSGGKPAKTMVAITIVSALVSIAGTEWYPAAAFYLLPTRIWELMIGCTLAALLRNNGFEDSLRTRTASILALVAIVISYTLDSQHSVAHSAMACLGTAMFLGTAAAKKNMAGRILSWPPLVLIGKLSFSLYLWHWPVFVIGRQIGDFGPLILIAISLTLALLTYFCVECPTRYMDNRTFGRVFAGLLAITGVALALPFTVARQGIEYTLPEFWSSINLEPTYDLGTFEDYKGDFRTGLILADGNTVEQLDVLVLGDSHALMFFPAIKTAVDNEGLALAFYGADGGTCPFFVGDDDISNFGKGWPPQQRREFDSCRKDFIVKHKPSLIFVCGNWTHYVQLFGKEQFSSHLANIVQAGAKSAFVFVGQPPILPFGSAGFSSGTLDLPPLRGFREDSDKSANRIEAHRLISSLCEKQSNCQFVATEKFFEGPLGIRFRDGQQLFYKDDDHLSVAGALQCVDAFKQSLSGKTQSGGAFLR